MPAKNVYHDAVRDTLVAGGWTITDDPLRIVSGGRNLYVDLAAEHTVVGAEREGERIAVEIQSFIGPSPVADLQQALGQFVIYRSAIARQEPDRTLFLAVDQKGYDGILSEPVGQDALTDLNVRLLVFDPDSLKVARWIS